MNLLVQKREKLGTSVTKQLRRGGFIPAEVYGRGVENVHIAVPARDFSRVFKQAGETSVITLEIDNQKIPALVHDVDHDPLSDAVRHIDFYRVRMDEKLQVRVPVEFVGQSPAVKAGGILVKAVQEIEVEALPDNMPHAIQADISRMAEMGSSVYARDLHLEEFTKKGITIKLSPDTVIATIIAPRAAEEAPVAAADISAVKVESEEKKVLRQAQDKSLRQNQDTVEREKTKTEEKKIHKPQ